MVPQECPVGAHDQHVDDVEADLDVAVGRVAREPGRCRDLKVAALDLAALEASLDVLGCGDVDENQSVVVAGDQVDLGSLGGSPTGIEKLEALALDEAGGCLDCLLLKFEIAHDDLRLFAAGPFGLPCDPEAAQVLAEGKESSENPAGPEFCAAKVFRALPEEPGSERVWRSQGRRRRMSRHREVLRNGLRMAGWPACFEREFESKVVGPDEATRMIACMTRNWSHRPQLSAIRGLARLRSELAAAFWSGNTTNDIPCFFIDMHMSTGARGTMRLRSGGYFDRTGPAESDGHGWTVALPHVGPLS